MKRIVCVLVLVLLNISSTFAQNKKLFQKAQVGMIVGTFAATDFSTNTKPFSLGGCLLANATVLTPRTYHGLMYGFGDNSFRVLNGYFLPKSWDTYIQYAKPLGASGSYLGLGIEKMIKIEKVAFFTFTEVGTDLKGGTSLSVGILMSVQHPVWKRT